MAPSNQNCFLRIKANYKNLSEKEKKIADFILIIQKRLFILQLASSLIY